MADVQSNEASTQAHVTPSSANVKEQECFVCKKQFGASDHVLRLPCNHKSCLTCMSEQEAEKLHAKQPISCRQCQRHISKIEMSVNSRTLMQKEKDFGIFLQSLMNSVIIAAGMLLARFIRISNTFFSSLQHLWVNIKPYHQSIWAVTTENLNMVWQKMKQFTSHFFSSICSVFSKIPIMGWEYRKRMRELYRRLFSPSKFVESTIPKFRHNALNESIMAALLTFVTCTTCMLFLEFPKVNGHADVLKHVQICGCIILFYFFSFRCLITIGRFFANSVYIIYHLPENPDWYWRSPSK